jgi:hypothetical protein
LFPLRQCHVLNTFVRLVQLLRRVGSHTAVIV